MAANSHEHVNTPDQSLMTDDKRQKGTQRITNYSGGSLTRRNLEINSQCHLWHKLTYTIPTNIDDTGSWHKTLDSPLLLKTLMTERSQ